jgi:hypothetical protein
MNNQSNRASNWIFLFSVATFQFYSVELLALMRHRIGPPVTVIPNGCIQ